MYINFNLDYKKVICIFRHKKIMKSILNFLAALFVWYVIISFITFNLHIDTWHFTARLSLLFFSLITFVKINK